MYTTDQISKAVFALYDHGGWGELYGDNNTLTIDGEEVNAAVVDERGGMDKGSHASVTIKVGDQYFTKEGYYASHYGYDWDGPFYESNPVEVSYTEYHKIDKG